MSHRFKLSGFLAIAAGIAIAVPVAISIQPADAATVTTAWQNGSFSLNPSGVVSESDIVLGAAEHRQQPVAATGQRLAGGGRLGCERVHRATEPQRHDAVPAVSRSGEHSRPVDDDLGVELQRHA